MALGLSWAKAQRWNELNGPLIDDWINRTSGVYTVCVEYYSAIKMNKILPFVTTWIYLEGIMLSESS